MGRKRKKPQHNTRTKKPSQHIPQTIAPQQQAEGGGDGGSNIPSASILVPISPQGPQSPSADNNARERRTERRDRWRLGVEIGAFFVGLGGIVGLIWTLSESQESNRIGREALTSVQRAYVSLKTIDSVGIRDAQGKVVSWQFFPQWENSGTTPTKVMYQHSNSKWPEETLPQNFDFHDAGENDNRPYLLGSRGTISTGPLVISPEVMTEVRDRKKHLYFWGWAAYRDVFKNSEPHLTEFCNELIISGGDIMTGEEVKFLHTACKSHNCADEGCADYKDTRKKLDKVTRATEVGGGRAQRL